MTNNRPVEGLGESSKNRPTPSPKGGVLFSFEPPIPLSVASCSGIETNESSYGSSKVRMNQILNVVQGLNDKLEKMDSRQRLIENKLNLLLKVEEDKDVGGYTSKNGVTML